MADGIVFIDQIGSGFVFNVPRLFDEHKWRDWFNGDYGSIIPSIPSIDNGYSLLGTTQDQILPNLQTVRMHEIASGFQSEALVSDGPSIVSETESGTNWFEERRFAVQKQLELMARDWSIYGLGVLVSYEDGSLHNVASPDYFRVGSVHDDDQISGHIIAYRYYEIEDATDRKLLRQALHRQYQRPNRCRVLRYMPSENINTVQEYRLNGTVVGEPLTPERPAGITNLLTVGNWDSWYKESEKTVAAFFIAKTLNGKAVYKNINRALILPSTVLASEGRRDTRTPDERMKAFWNRQDPVIESDGSTKASDMGLVPGDYNTDALYNEMIYAAQTFYFMTGTPPVAFGLSIGKNESGLAREKAEARAAIRIRNARDDLAKGFPGILEGMGAPPMANFSVSWTSNPFETALDREEKIMLQYQAGILERNEAREMLGLRAVDEEENPDIEDESEGDNNGDNTD